MDQNQRDKIRGCFLGLAIGDALGMPVETMSHKAIMTATGGVRSYLAPIQKRLTDTMNMAPGSWTDDTQLTLAMARSLARLGGYDQMDQARELATALRASIFGWGATTMASAEEMARYFEQRPGSRDPHDPAPAPSVDGKGSGNGVAMKIAPLALWFGPRVSEADDALFLETVMKNGLMTHGDPRASYAGLAVGLALREAFAWPLGTEPTEAFRLRVMTTVLDGVIVAEKRYADFRPNADRLSDRLYRAFRHLDDADRLREQTGVSCFSMESVPFSIATYLRQPNDYRSAVEETVNAGGDTDSNASIVGGLVGATLGLTCLPPELIEGLQGKEEILAVTESFITALATK